MLKFTRMKSSPKAKQISTLLLLSSWALIALAVAVTMTTFYTAGSEKLSRRNVGNSAVGSDLYGIGVRTGLYLQGFAFTINIIVARETRGDILLASGALQFSILTSFSILILRSGSQSMSPAEALLMLNILAFSTMPTICAIFGIKVGAKTGGHAVGIGMFILDSLWFSSLLTWFWAKGYRTLPSLGTPGAAFFYTKVQIDGWFRIFSLVLAVLHWILIILLVVFAVYLWIKSVRWWWTDRKPKIRDWEEWVQKVVIIYAVFYVFWSLGPQVAGSEMIIRYNSLEPNNDLSSPGQLIPFITGIVTLLDSVLGVCRHTVHQNFIWQ